MFAKVTQGGSFSFSVLCVKLNVGRCRYGSVVPLCTVAILSACFSFVYPPCSMLLTPALTVHQRVVSVWVGTRGRRTRLKIALDNL